MKCYICGNDTLVERDTSQLFERGNLSIVIRHIPSLVCTHCGEVYHTAGVTDQLLKQAEAMIGQQEAVPAIPAIEYRAA